MGPWEPQGKLSSQIHAPRIYLAPSVPFWLKHQEDMAVGTYLHVGVQGRDPGLSNLLLHTHVDFG